MIPAGQTAEQDLGSLLDGLMQQNTMAPFICQQLIQHLVTSNPSPAYISAESRTSFSTTAVECAATCKAVITAILTDPEARAADEQTTVSPRISATFASRFCSWPICCAA
jgi:uncharacterized protein (DUF1800 family)